VPQAASLLASEHQRELVLLALHCATRRSSVSRLVEWLARLSGRAARVRWARLMTTDAAVADLSAKTVSFAGKLYAIQALGDDSYTVLVAGVPVGRIVLSFGVANGVPEGDAISEDDLTAVGEAWFAAVG
jgi:hypothetical protein